jgi:hypothetical protein
LLKSVADPDGFVKSEFQKVFKENASNIYDLNEEFAKSFKLPNGKKVGSKTEFIQLTETDIFAEQLTFIKVE